jgi:multiple sugar transport system substrate-binding protein
MSKQDDWESELTGLPLGSGGFSQKTMKKVKERIALEKKRNQGFRPAVAIAAITVLTLSGLLFRDGAEQTFRSWFETNKPSNSVTQLNDQAILRVEYPDQSWFMSSFGRTFSLNHPAIQFETVHSDGSTETAEKYVEWIKQNHPDIITVPLAYIDDLANAGIIQPLDPWILRDNVKLESLNGSVLRTLKEAGSGVLYGFAPKFTTSGLYYNEKLFDEENIPYPTDGMSWDEVFRLAARFPGKSDFNDNSAGLNFGPDVDAVKAILSVGEIEGLSLVDAKGKPVLNSSSWTEVWRTVLGGMKEGWIKAGKSSPWNPKDDPFLSGHAAMEFASDTTLDHLRLDSNSQLGDSWGLVAGPVDTARPDRDGAFQLREVLAINASTPHPEAAWAFLLHTVGQEEAERAAANEFNSLTSNESTVTENDARAPFYHLKADAAEVVRKAETEQTTIYRKVLVALSEAGKKEAEAILRGDVSVEDALAVLQSNAEAAYMKLMSIQEVKP